ncbi:MAG: acetylglutamate kinase [Bacteroidota bacterium]
MKKEPLLIVKIGGQLLEREVELSGLLDEVVAYPGPQLLVHGGGKKATELAQRLGLEVQMIAGRRVTDAASLEIAAMVYAGWYNKRLVAQLQGRGQTALGLCGADLDLIRCRKRAPQPVDYGWVGDIEAVEVGALLPLLRAGICPVFSAITHDGKGQLLNTNADTIATQLAIALAPHFAVDLRYCLELPGVLVEVDQPESQLARLNQSDYRDLLRSGQIKGGMIPKLDNAFRAHQQSVSTVRIGNPHSLFNQSATQIC